MVDYDSLFMNLLKLTHNKALCGRRKRKIVLNRSVGAEDWSSIHLLVTETKGNNGLLHLLNMGKGSRLLIWLQPRLFLPLTLRMCVSCIFRFPPQITPKGQTRGGGAIGGDIYRFTVFRGLWLGLLLYKTYIFKLFLRLQ